MIKARVHMIVSLPETDAFSFRTDVLTLTRDAEGVYKAALDCVMRQLLYIRAPAHQAKILSHVIEWVPSLRDVRDQTEAQPTAANATVTEPKRWGDDEQVQPWEQTARAGGLYSDKCEECTTGLTCEDAGHGHCTFPG